MLTTNSRTNSTGVTDRTGTVQGTNATTTSTGIPVRRAITLVRALTCQNVGSRITKAKLGGFFLILRAKTSRAGPGVIKLSGTLRGLGGGGVSTNTVGGVFKRRNCGATSMVLRGARVIGSFATTIANAGITCRRTTVGDSATRTGLRRTHGGVGLTTVSLKRGLGPTLAIDAGVLAGILGCLPKLVS